MTKVVGAFRKSSYSGQQGNCVEVAATTDDGRAVRDSKRQDGPLIAVSGQSWQAFVRQFA
ncbi:DUF397 domain-containing protein [Streptomyces phaeoluteigriseus]|uniref:DUF397 domain-containing protein n=1 Tax=Streptomyces phaeoluteigriseus TaxID=114686 RepID=A0ABY4ZIN2_9ACTN|nr:DUF397 domain-containing protein [Streptomyces phaeoluteigriseus]USQ88964.1 DUF397 domain-containing protein [Streptomyces phaeoluteigriseus]